MRLVTAEERPGDVGSEDRYGLALIAILGLMALTPLLTTFPAGRSVLVLVFGATLLLVYRVSHASQRALRILLFTVLVGAVVSVGAMLSGSDAATRLVPAVAALYVAAGPYVVVRRLLQHDRITLATVKGALCVYLLVGQFFAVLYPVISLITRSPFFVQTSSPGTVDYLYFSFITLATVGYGDLTPASGIGRIVAMTEGLLGQLYLVTVVAILVGNLGRARPQHDGEDGDTGG